MNRRSLQVVLYKRDSMKKWFWGVLVVLVLALALVGCQSSGADKGGSETGTQGNTETVPVVRKEGQGNVIAEGNVQPARAGSLSFVIPGTVAQVFVEVGDKAAAGETLAQLDVRELQLALRSAQQDVAAQEAALQQLLNGASDNVIRRADKGNADQVAQAEVAVSIKRLQLEQAQTEDPSVGVKAAQARIRQLELTLAQTRAQDPSPSVQSAEVTLERARIALADTQDEYDKALDRPWEDQSIRDNWAKQLEQRQLDYKAAQAQLQAALNAKEAHTVSLGIFAAQIEEAQTQLAQALVAQETYSTTLEILAADVRVAELQLESLRTWDNPYRDEASPDEIAQMRAVLEKTQIGVEQLELQLEDGMLVAPFSGTVVEVYVKEGDQANPGQVAVVLATLDELEIQTTDLTELDIGGVEVGQTAQITADAFPSLSFTGQVTEIDLQSQDYRGDVVYKVTVVPTEDTVPQGLRWGMTCVVEIGTR